MTTAATLSSVTSDVSPRTAAVRVVGLAKKYGDIQAVRGIDLDIRHGEIFGLIGPDGAGKTTTFQILAGVMEPTSGVAEIFGHPARQMRSQTGYLTQAFSLYPELTVKENIRYVGDLRSVPPRDIASRATRYLELFDMLRFQDRLAGRLSGGMKQKLALACALVPQPRVLLLDEPTTGVDPVSRREFWDVLAHLAGDGLTVVVATPYLDEAERCHRVALMHQGVLHRVGAPADIKQSVSSQRLELRTPDLGIAEQLLSGEARETTDIKDVQRFGDRLDVLVADTVVARSAIATLFRSKGMTIPHIQVGQPTLENTFVATLRALGDDTRSEAFPGDHDNEHLRGRIAIGATNLTKHFGSFTAVKDVNIHIKYGEVYGLLGANGAGKTTTIKMLCGLLAPTSGQMQLAGETGSLRSQAVRQQLGYMSQKFSLYDDLSIEENLAFFAGVYGVPDSERAARRHWALSFAGLEGKEKLVTGSLPGGWKQRVALGAAIMHEPSILFLDEPTSGVDPLARRAFWKVINHLADLGTAILVTTHYLEEAEQCNRIGFMVAGELVAEGTPSEIKGRQEGTLLELSVDKPQFAADVLKQDLDRWRISLFGDRLHVISDDTPIRGIERTTSRLARHGIRVLSARDVTFSLEDVFIGVVEKARQQGKVAVDN